jgi:hypothetical protein
MKAVELFTAEGDFVAEAQVPDDEPTVELVVYKARYYVLHDDGQFREGRHFLAFDAAPTDASSDDSGT